MSNKWNDNVQLLEGVLNEMIEEEKVQEVASNIYSEFGKVINNAYKKQYNYKNYEEMNQSIMISMDDYISNIKKQLVSNKKKSSNVYQQQMQVQQDYRNGKMPYQPQLVTHEDLVNSRSNEFNNSYEQKKKDFEESIRLKPPQDIDFSDKGGDDNADIDKLMEEELKKRSYEITMFNNDFKNSSKDAENWIFNGNQSQGQPEPKSVNNENIRLNVEDTNLELPKLKIDDTIVDIDDSIKNVRSRKNVSFIDEKALNTPISPKPLNFLSKLKKDKSVSYVKDDVSGNAIKEGYLEIMINGNKQVINSSYNSVVIEDYSIVLGLEEQFVLSKIYIPKQELNYKIKELNEVIKTNTSKLNYLDIKIKLNNEDTNVVIYDSVYNSYKIDDNDDYIVFEPFTEIEVKKYYNKVSMKVEFYSISNKIRIK